MIVLCIHAVLLFFGFITSIFLIVAIIRATPSTAKNYSVLLFWSAFNDLVAVTTNIIAMERLTVVLPSLIFIPSGPCTLVSRDFCNYCNSVFIGTVVESTIIQCISFWYRLRILWRPPPKTILLQLILITFSLPHIGHMVVFTRMKQSVFIEELRHIYPKERWEGAYLYGFPDIFDPMQALTYSLFFLEIPAIFAFLIHTRSRILHELKEKRSMSDKTHAMHHLFLKVLTIHALLPITILLGCVCNVPIFLGLRNSEFEELLFLTSTIPAIVSAAITIWYIQSYREYITILLCCNRLSQLSQQTSIHGQSITI